MARTSKNLSNIEKIMRWQTFGLYKMSKTILKQRVVKQTETNKEFRAVIASKSKKIVKT